MEAMTGRSVDGAVDLDYVPSGVRRLTCPAADALEPWEQEQISVEGENRTDSATGGFMVQTTLAGKAAARKQASAGLQRDRRIH
jgi:hypothetical protein